MTPRHLAIDQRSLPLTCHLHDNGRCEDCPLRRIWQVDREALDVLLGMLVSRELLESLARRTDPGSTSELRDDVLLSRAVASCTRACPVAAELEAMIERQTGHWRLRWAGCPMVVLADWWAANRTTASASELAAFLWAVSTDTRPEIGHLVRKVVATIRLRALRGLGS